jgi:PKD repeat protein
MDRIKKHIIPFLWLAFCCIPELNAQVHSAFSVNDSTGCENLIVNFTNGSTGTGTLSYNWNFGNGTFSTLQNPSVFYNQPGEYTVRLITTNGIIADTLTKSNFINVFSQTNSSVYAYGETTGCKPMKVKLASTSIPGDNDQFIRDMGYGRRQLRIGGYC